MPHANGAYLHTTGLEFFCNNQPCIAGITDIKYWLGGWYDNMKFWATLDTTVKMIKEFRSEYNSQFTKPVFHWKFDISNYNFFTFGSIGERGSSFSFFTNYSTGYYFNS